MKIGLLIIGNEILDGKINDLNTKSLATFLRQIHLELNLVLISADKETSIHHALRALLDQCDVVVTSGGMGPTRDDVTKQALASFFNQEIFFSEASYEVCLKNYQRFKRPFENKQHGYCFIPEDFVPLENSSGFAPCLFMSHRGKFLLSLPGVPKEFNHALIDHFRPLIVTQFPPHPHVMGHITARTKRIPEEKIFGEIDPLLWDKLARFGSVSSLPSLLGVDIAVKISAENEVELNHKKQQLHRIFTNSPVASSIWQLGDMALEDYIVAQANAKNVTYGFAESCTGGLCSHRVTNVPGSSKTFLGSIISYSEEVKKSLLHVSPETLHQFGVVSSEVASEMSQGLAQLLNVDVGISITGFAGPGGGSLKVPVGTAYVGVSYKTKTKTFRLNLFGDREQLKQRFAQAALFYLLEELESLPTFSVAPGPGH